MDEPEKAQLVRDLLISSEATSVGTLVAVKHRGAATAYASELGDTDEIDPLTTAQIVDDTGGRRCVRSRVSGLLDP